MSDAPQHSLSGIFCKVAAEVCSAFPHELRNIAITSLDEPIFVSNDAADLLAQNVAAVKAILAHRRQGMAAMGAVGNIGLQNIGGQDVLLMTLDFESELGIFFSNGLPPEINMLGVMLHEFGHIVAPGGRNMGYPNPHKKECVADAFAFLCYLKHFGARPEFFDSIACHRSGHSVVGISPPHDTSIIAHRIASLVRDGLDVRTHRYEDLAKLASEIAFEYHPAFQTAKRVHEAYAPVREHYKLPQAGERDWGKMLDTIAGIMLTHKDDHDIYRAGRLYISQPYIQEHVARLGLAPLFAFMPQHEKQSDFILNAADAKDAKNAADERALRLAQRGPIRRFIDALKFRF